MRQDKVFTPWLAKKSFARVAGVYDSLTGVLAEQAGFDAVWLSGLSVSASRVIPDTDLLTMVESHSVAADIAASLTIPVIADCDAGYGGPANVARMARLYERSGIAAIAIEDKPFPKANSFLEHDHELIAIEEFSAKLRAAKNAQHSGAMGVIARLEGFIAKKPLNEILDRAHAYCASGADALIVHSKRKDATEVLEFLRNWKANVPVILIPTTYYQIPAEELRKAGAAMVIYANHALRANVTASIDIFQSILAHDSSIEVEDRIARVSDVFRIQDRYLEHHGGELRNGV